MRKILVMMAIAVILAAASPAGAVNTDIKLTDTLTLEQSYKLHLVSVDLNSSPRTAVLRLNHAGDEKEVASGDEFSLYDGQALIVTAKLDAVFAGATGTMVQIKNLVQYDKNTGEIILTVERLYLYIPYHPHVKNYKPVTDTFGLKQGYKLQLMAADDQSTPVQIWLQLIHGGVVDDKVVALGDNFSLYDGNVLVVNATFAQLFLGSTGYMAQLKDLTQYNNNGRIILYLDRVILEKPY